MDTYSVLVQQSLFDIAVELYGDVEGVFWLIADNPGLALTDRLQIGQQLFVRAGSLNIRQATYLADFAPFQTIDEVDRPAGIGYWLLNEYLVG